MAVVIPFSPADATIDRLTELVTPDMQRVNAQILTRTGSEVTKNAVLASPEHGVKASLRSPLMMARAAIVDPDLLRACRPPCWPPAASTRCRS